jgi:hypothetical protein
MFPDRVIGILRTLVMLSALCACSGLGRVVYDQPTAPGSVDRSYLFNAGYRVPHIHFELPEIALAVVGDRDATSAFVGPLFLPFIPWPPGIVSLILARDSEPDPPLWIHLRIAPKVEEIAFNPAKAFLITKDGRHLYPIRLRGPTPLSKSHVWGDRSIIYYNCGEKAFEKLVELEMSIKEQVCVTLEYELSAVPSEPFTLFIEGFSHSRKAIAVPPISFHKASHIDWYGFGNDF